MEESEIQAERCMAVEKRREGVMSEAPTLTPRATTCSPPRTRLPAQRTATSAREGWQSQES
eukprot:1257466-Rhodomonas_salina.4